MKEEKCDSLDFKSCVQFVGRCEELLVTGKFEIKGNGVGNKFRVVGLGTPRKCLSVSKKIFHVFIDI